jgi:hypothetical protein
VQVVEKRLRRGQIFIAQTAKTTSQLRRSDIYLGPGSMPLLTELFAFVMGFYKDLAPTEQVVRFCRILAATTPLLHLRHSITPPLRPPFPI